MKLHQLTMSIMLTVLTIMPIYGSFWRKTGAFKLSEIVARFSGKNIKHNSYQFKPQPSSYLTPGDHETCKVIDNQTDKIEGTTAKWEDAERRFNDLPQPPLLSSMRMVLSKRNKLRLSLNLHETLRHNDLAAQKMLENNTYCDQRGAMYRSEELKEISKLATRPCSLLDEIIPHQYVPHFYYNQLSETHMHKAGKFIDKYYNDKHHSTTCGKTLLHDAASSGDNNYVHSLLLNHDGNPNVEDEMRDTPLDKAIKFSNYDTAALLLQNGAKSTNSLIRAIEEGDTNTTRFLLENGADPNIRTSGRFKKTPLHIAFQKGDMNLAYVLLENGAYPHMEDEREMSPLQDFQDFHPESY